MPRRYWYVILTYIIMQFSGIIGAPLLHLLTPLTIMEASIYWTIFSFLAGLVIVLVMMKPDMEMRSARDAASFGGVILWSVTGFFMAYLAQVAAVMIETMLLGIEPGSENTQFIMEISQATPLFVIIPMIIAPILEEIVFRKIIFGSFYKHMNFFFAALLSALIFGFIHGEPQHILIYASMGFVFSYVYVKTKRLIAPILVHAGMNSFAVIAQYSMTPEEIQQQLDQLQMILIGG